MEKYTVLGFRALFESIPVCTCVPIDIYIYMGVVMCELSLNNLAIVGQFACKFFGRLCR